MDDGRWTSRAMLAVFLIVFAWAIAAMVMTGCAGAPVQKPAQTIAPASNQGAVLKDLQAKVISLAQSNQTLIQAIQKSSQDADQFRTEVKGSVASLTQNSFRFESWWATVSKRIRPRLLGFGGFDVLVPAAGNDSDLGKPGGAARGGGNDSRGNSPPGQVKWRPTMLQLTVAFLLGAVLSSVVLGILAALHQVIADHILSHVGAIVKWIWEKFVGLIALFKPKPKATA